MLSSERVGFYKYLCDRNDHQAVAGKPKDAPGRVIESIEDEHFITIHHPMTKVHYISFVAYVSSDRIQMVKLYPEGNAQTRLQLQGMGYLYYYCNRHGLFRKKI